jgi:hypothetical protein
VRDRDGLYRVSDSRTSPMQLQLARTTSDPTLPKSQE